MGKDEASLASLSRRGPRLPFGGLVSRLPKWLRESEGGKALAKATFSPAPGTWSASQSVTIACATSGAKIRYTTDGTEPTASSRAYTRPIAVTVSTTLVAKAAERL